MKEQGEYEREISITQMDGGYVVECSSGSRKFRKIFGTFSLAINCIAFEFDLVKIGEYLKFASGPEPVEKKGE